MKKFIKSHFLPFFKYSLVGAFITLLDLGLVYVFREFVLFSVILASGLAFIIANFTSFVLNKLWTFKDKNKKVLRQYVKFVFTSIIGLGLTIFFMWLFYSRLNLFHSLIEKNYLICKMLTSGIVVLWNFLMNRFWTFSPSLKLHFPAEEAAKRKYGYDLSIVIPAYNESRRISATLSKIIKYLKILKMKTEIIVVNDGSSDGTEEVVKNEFGNVKNLRIISNPVNYGKGYSVKRGVMNSAGRYILFTDADNSTPIEEFAKFMPYLDGHTVLIGSRYKKNPSTLIKKQPFYRIIISRIGNYLIKLFLSLDISDTQCGFKLFPHTAAHHLFGLAAINRFGFDMEVLALASLSGIEIREIPVNWFDSVFTRVRPFRDAISTFTELIRIKINIWKKYYHKKAGIKT